MELLNTLEKLNLTNEDRRLSADTQTLRRRSSRGGNSGTILQVLGENKRFSKICEIIEKSGSLRNELDNDSNSITFFAPTNEALCKFHDLVKGIEEGRKLRGLHGRDRVELPKIDDILKYHTISEEVQLKDMYNGQLLVTELKEKDLGDKKYQRINVQRRLGSIVLNMCVRVEEVDCTATNGIIHPIDLVLLPPMDAFDVIFMVPFVCSTMASALQQCELDEVLMDEGNLTVLVPTNSAWMQMNVTDLVYLFSPMGRQDLRKILEYHVCTEIIYAADMIKEKKEIAIPTMLKKEEIVIRVMDLDQKKKRGSSGGRRERLSPDEFLIVVNEGEARVKVADVITRNGNLHFINSVLVPESVCLPSRRLNKGADRLLSDKVGLGFGLDRGLDLGLALEL